MAMYTAHEAIDMLDTTLTESDDSDIEDDPSFPLPRSESEDEDSIVADNTMMMIIIINIHEIGELSSSPGRGNRGGRGNGTRGRGGGNVRGGNRGRGRGRVNARGGQLHLVEGALLIGSLQKQRPTTPHHFYHSLNRQDPD